MSAIGDVKQKIYDKLATLVGSGLGAITITDIKHDPLDMEIQTYPHAFVMPPAIQTVSRLDNKTHIRDLVFNVLVIQKMDNISPTTGTKDIEDLIQSMLDVIDNSITLDNVAVGGVEPSSSFPEAFIHNGRSLVVFDIIIKARVTQSLTFA